MIDDMIFWGEYPSQIIKWINELEEKKSCFMNSDEFIEQNDNGVFIIHILDDEDKKITYKTKNYEKAVFILVSGEKNPEIQSIKEMLNEIKSSQFDWDEIYGDEL